MVESIDCPQPTAALRRALGGRTIAVIGGGPAGLRAAEVAACAGVKVTLFDAKPSVGRKFLVAGRGGLNLTNTEDLEHFAARYTGPSQPPGLWSSLLADFGPEAAQKWAADLGIETFAARTGRVYPREMKAAPLLRRWVKRLRDLGVQFATRHRWTRLISNGNMRLEFEQGGETRKVEADAVVLALGGGSWPQTGSDGTWIELLAAYGIAVAKWQPANCGWEYPWPLKLLDVAEGKPLKNILVRAGEREVLGELLITRYGLEGGAIYQLGADLRGMTEPAVTIDLKPTFSVEQLVKKLGSVRRNFLAEARERWHLSEGALAILDHVNRQPFVSAQSLAEAAKSCTLHLTRARPIAEAISSAGGLCWSELDSQLMLRKLPGVFVAGEMIDWEAPTGGYLIQGCFATGTRAAHGAVGWLTQAHPGCQG